MNRPPRDPGADLLGDFPDFVSGDRWQPAIDIFETEKAIVVRVELGGVQSHDVKVSVDGGALRVRGERRPPETEGLLRLHRVEVAFGRFERIVEIPVPFERNAVSAHLEDGFLRVVLPKRAPTRRRVAVRTEGAEKRAGEGEE